MISILTNDNFDRAVTPMPGLHVVRFWAEWCGPCRMMAPLYAQAARDMQEQAHFAEVDIDAAPELASRFRVQSIPTVLLFKDGKVLDRMTGAGSKAAIEAFVSRHLD